MYTRCPQCETVFHLTQQQLAERNGIVRCGQCATIFRADQNIVADPQQEEVATGTAGRARRTTSAKRPRPVVAATPQKTSPKTATPNPETVASLPTARELLLGKKPARRTRPLFWALGNLVLLLILASQLMYFRSSELARHPDLRPVVVWACEVMGCHIRPLQDVNLVELAQTTVAPHPEHEGVLSIRASLINRASFAQAFPRMEVSLLNRQGEVVARRQFTATEYLRKSAHDATTMPPNIAFKALLEITSPQVNTEGYEIRLLPA